MKPVCGKCFKVAEKKGSLYVCPTCNGTVAYTDTMKQTGTNAKKDGVVKL